MKTKRFLAMLLAVAMVLSLLPAPAWAVLDPDDGMILNKTATADGEGTYTIDLEAYATGKTVTVSKRQPTDIIVVMDVSGSMMDPDFATSEAAQIKDYTAYWSTAMKLQENGEQFYHGSSNHAVTLIKITNFTGTILHYNTGSGYTVKRSVSTAKDIYGFYCPTCYSNDETYHKFGDETLTCFQNVKVNGDSQIDYSAEYDSSYYYYYDGMTSQLKHKTSNITRLAAMEERVNAFLDSIAADNEGHTDEAMQHRVALIKFSGIRASGDPVGNDFYKSSDAEDGSFYIYDVDDYESGMINLTQTLYAMDHVTSDVCASMKSAVNELIAAGYTATGNAMAEVNRVLEENKASAEAENRKQIVLLFTDGEPTTGTVFEADVANAALSYAVTAKSTYGTEIYTINMMPEDSITTQMDNFMSYLSSNYEDVAAMGTQNATVDKGYSRHAGSMGDLNSIFEDIQSTVSGSSIPLSGDADLRDYMAEGVVLTDKTVVTAYIADYAGNGTWEDAVEVQLWNGSNTKEHAVQISVDKTNNSVSVTGFDYAANYVMDKDDGSWQGKKLMVKITAVDVTEGAIETETGLIYTNKDTSGVYPSKDSNEPADLFPRPYVHAEDDTIDVDKSAVLTDDGTYTINLEAFASGRVRTHQERKPTDIIIVLDVSGSMDEYLETPEWTVYTGSLEESLTKQTDGTRFAHKASDGTFHEVELSMISSFKGDVFERTYVEDVGAYRYDRSKSPAYSYSSAKDIYVYYCTEESCGFIDNDNDEPFFYGAFTYTSDLWGNKTYTFKDSFTDFCSITVGAGSTGTYPDYMSIYYAPTYNPRMDAMKEAVNGFIDTTVADCAGFETSKQHRISLVKFAGEYFEDLKVGNHFHDVNVADVTSGDNVYQADDGNYYYVTDAYNSIDGEYCIYNCAQILTYSQYANAANADSLKATVDSMIAGGATQAQYGFQLADDVLGKNTAWNADRDQIVLFFTDGSPTDNTDFNPDVANAAIAAAKVLKDKDAKIYSISLSPEGHTDEDNMHDYMELVSSFYPNATTMDDIDPSREDEDNPYHKTVHNTEELKNIFDTITQDISGTTVELDAAAQLRDYLAQGFNLTENSVITVQTVPYDGKNADGDPAWKTAEAATVQVYNCSSSTNTMENDVTVSVDSETKGIFVSGFSYKDNYVAEVGGKPEGCKLVVTITGIEATDEAIAAAKETEDGFIPTNLDTSGVYPNDVSDTPVALFIPPEVKLTSKIYVLDYAKPATLAASDWQAARAEHLDVDGMNFIEEAARSIDEVYGRVDQGTKVVDGDTLTDNTVLVYTPQTTLWNGYDSFYVFGKETQKEDSLNLWSRISVLPANNVYYEDTFLTTEDSSTVGIVYNGNWKEYLAPETGELETETVEQWVKVNFADITAEDTVAITMSKDGNTWVLPNTGEGTSKQPLANIAGTISDNVLTVEADPSAFSWNIAPTEGGYHITAGENYLYTTATNNGLRVGATEAVWNVSSDYLTANDTQGVLRYMGVFSNQDWRCYNTIHANIAGQTLEFWVLTEEEVPADNTSGESGTNTEDENGAVHGWVDDLADDSGFTDGSAHGATIGSAEEMAAATFKFTGTGVDVYTYTDIKSGAVSAALVRCDDDGNPVSMEKFLIIDNLAVSGEYYQIPTLSFTGLEYGTYQVSLGVRRSPAVELVDHDGNPDTPPVAQTVEGEYRATYYLDGIRVYNPLGDPDKYNEENPSAYFDSVVQEAYTDELSAIFQEVRQSLIDTNSFDANSEDVSGTVFIDLNGNLSGEGTISDLTDVMDVYKPYGPDNEVYLAPGQGIAFKVDKKADASFYLGIKSPAPGVNINNPGAAVTASQVTLTNEKNVSPVAIGHTSDLYYKVTPNDDGLIFVMNSGETLISITKLRSTGSSVGIINANAAEITAYLNGFRSLPVVDYVEQPEPPVEPTPEPSLWEAIAQIRSLLEELFGSLDSWFNP